MIETKLIIKQHLHILYVFSFCHRLRLFENLGGTVYRHIYTDTIKKISKSLFYNVNRETWGFTEKRVRPNRWKQFTLIQRLIGEGAMVQRDCQVSYTAHRWLYVVHTRCVANIGTNLGSPGIQQLQSIDRMNRKKQMCGETQCQRVMQQKRMANAK